METNLDGRRKEEDRVREREENWMNNERVKRQEKHENKRDSTQRR